MAAAIAQKTLICRPSNVRTIYITVARSNELKDEKIKSFEEIPGPPVVNAFRFLLRYSRFLGGFDIRRIHEIAFSRFKEFGAIRKEVIPKRFKAVLPLDPKDIEKVFRNEGKRPHRAPFSVVNYLRSAEKDNYHGSIGFFTADTNEWYSLRSKTQSTMMRPKIVASYIPEVNRVADDMITLMKMKRKEDMKIDDFMAMIYNWALESLGVFALDMRFGCLNASGPTAETEKLINAVNDTVAALTMTETGVPTWKYFPTKGWRLLKRSQEFIRHLTVKRIADIRESLKSETNEDDLSFLERLVSEGKLTEGELLCFIMDLFMAGIDTTSHSLAFCMYHLAKNPDVTQKLRSEIMSIIPVVGGEITAAKIEKMKYLKACLKESMRVSATVIGTSRILNEDIILSNYNVPKGTALILQSMVSSNLEMNIDEPTKFFPDRWLQEKPPMHRFAFFPFGYGPRMCIGKRIAEQEIYILLIKLIQHFNLKFDGEMGIYTRLVNIPDKPLDFEFIDH